MKSISTILKNIRNLLPYFMLIAIYFFFINLEARNDNDINTDTKKEKMMSDKNTSFGEKNYRIKIPVVPYKE